MNAETRLAAFELLLEKAGDFLLEVAVLVFVFVPIDFWRGPVSVLQISTLVFVAGGAFLVGLACHWVLRIIMKGRRSEA